MHTYCATSGCNCHGPYRNHLHCVGWHVKLNYSAAHQKTCFEERAFFRVLRILHGSGSSKRIVWSCETRSFRMWILWHQLAQKKKHDLLLQMQHCALNGGPQTEAGCPVAEYVFSTP